MTMKHNAKESFWFDSQQQVRWVKPQKSIDGDICIAMDAETLEEIHQLRKKRYKTIYPSMDLDNDVLDYSALNIYTRNQSGDVNSTARLAFDGPNGLPEDRFLGRYRYRGKRLLEWGRFVIDKSDMNLLRLYYWTVFNVASSLSYDAVVMAMKPKDISFHQRLIGIDVTAQDMKINYGGKYWLACVVWDVEKTKAKFFRWVGANNE